MTAPVLHLSKDRKVSPRGIQQPGGMRPGRWIPTVRNSFGLPAGVSCPGKTAFCTSCYGVRSENATGVQQALEHNLAALQEAGTVDAMAALLDQAVTGFVNAAQRLVEVQDRRRVHVPLRDDELLFRIHWDGDFFSIEYAQAWARVIAKHPQVRFWCYTRSFRDPVNVVPILVSLPNLALYLSVDADNVDDALPVLAAHPTVLAAWCGVDYRETRALAARADRAVAPIPCPENIGRIPLMANGEGACVTCAVCPDARRDIFFASSHREDASSVIVTIGGRACRNPACTNRIAAGSGRPRLYCTPQCRWAMYHAKPRRKARKRVVKAPRATSWPCVDCGATIVHTGKRGRPRVRCAECSPPLAVSA